MPKTTILSKETVQRDGKPDASIEIHSITQEDQQKQQLRVFVTVNEKTHEHRILVGTDEAPLPDNYDLAQLERDIEAAKQHAIAMADGHVRSAGLVEQWAAKKKLEGTGL